MAADWSDWASDCARHDDRPVPAVLPTELTLTATLQGERAWLVRVDMASGTVRRDADVLPFRRRPAQP